MTVAPLLPDPPARPPWVVLLPGEPRLGPKCVCMDEVPPRFWLKNAISGWNIQTSTQQFSIIIILKQKRKKSLQLQCVKTSLKIEVFHINSGVFQEVKIVYM